MLKCSISLLDKTLSCATTPGQSGPGNDGNKRVFCIPQSFRITGITTRLFNVRSRTVIEQEMQLYSSTDTATPLDVPLGFFLLHISLSDPFFSFIASINDEHRLLGSTV